GTAAQHLVIGPEENLRVLLVRVGDEARIRQEIAGGPFPDVADQLARAGWGRSVRIGPGRRGLEGLLPEAGRTRGGGGGGPGGAAGTGRIRGRAWLPSPIRPRSATAVLTSGRRHRPRTSSHAGRARRAALARSRQNCAAAIDRTRPAPRTAGRTSRPASGK